MKTKVFSVCRVGKENQIGRATEFQPIGGQHTHTHTHTESQLPKESQHVLLLYFLLIRFKKVYKYAF